MLTVLANHEVVLLLVTSVIVSTAATATHLATLSVSVVVISRLDIYSLVHDVMATLLLVVVDANDAAFDLLCLILAGET